MKTPETHRFLVKSSRPPVVEIDSVAHAVYVRFKKGKVARTVDCDATAMHVAVDLDASGHVIGVEGIGMNQFNIEFLLKRARVEAPAAAVARTRYVPAMMSAREYSPEPVGAN
ncbi:MAG: DUF2283 domain-containing protein [Limisphaerales bacterium]